MSVQADRCPSCGALRRPGAEFCPSCGTSLRAASAPPPPPPPPAKTGKPVWVFALAGLAVVVFVWVFIDHLPGGKHPVVTEQPVVTAEPVPAGGHADQVPVSPAVQGGVLSIPAAAVIEKKIVEFEYSDGTVTVPLLAFLNGESRIVTAFRMCEPCNSKKFSIDGDRLSCGNCETQWSLNTLEGLQGTCQKYAPEPFPSRIENGLVLMDIGRIKAWQIRL